MSKKHSKCDRDSRRPERGLSDDLNRVSKDVVVKKATYDRKPRVLLEAKYVSTVGDTVCLWLGKSKIAVRRQEYCHLVQLWDKSHELRPSPKQMPDMEPGDPCYVTEGHRAPWSIAKVVPRKLS